ncbi:MAG: putative membrane protein YdjX (TVP38/TMEM64 family) [Porticoccus sp.]
MNKTKILLVIVIIAVIASYIFFDIGRFLTLSFIQSQLSQIQQFRDENFGLTALLYFTAYIVITALSIPGAVIVTLLGGAIFGVLWGTFIVSFASSIGATLAFLVSRLLLRDWVQSKFGHYLGPINRGVEKDGNFYLFSIRMVPLFPFFIVNLLMGLTPISVGSFYIVSQIGMLVGTAVYVNAGSELAQITSLSGLVSPSVILSFVLLGIFPLVAKFIVGLIKRKKL